MLHVEDDTTLQGAEVVEVGLLLLRNQVVALEQAARRRGLTAGQAVRRLIGEFLRQQFSNQEEDR